MFKVVNEFGEDASDFLVNALSDADLKCPSPWYFPLYTLEIVEEN